MSFFLIFGYVSCKNKSKSPEFSGNLVWLREKKEALQSSERESRKLFLFFTADECEACDEFIRYTGASPQVEGVLQRYILLKVKNSDPDFENFRDDDRFAELRIKIPFFAIMNSSEEILFKSFDPVETVQTAGTIR